MDHAPNSDTFQKHYLNRNVCGDLWAIHRAQEPQHDLLKQATSHGSSRNSRRPIALTKKQSDAIRASDPQYQRHKAQLQKLPKLDKQRIVISNRLKQVWAKLRHEGIEKARAEWDRTRALDDVERQIRGRPGQFAPYSGRPSQPMSPAQKRMFDALQSPLVNDLQAQFERRHCAVMAIMAYCNVGEPLNTKVMEAQRAPSPLELSEPDPMERARQYRASFYGSVGQVSLDVDARPPNLPAHH